MERSRKVPARCQQPEEEDEDGHGRTAIRNRVKEPPGRVPGDESQLGTGRDEEDVAIGVGHELGALAVNVEDGPEARAAAEDGERGQESSDSVDGVSESRQDGHMMVVRG